MKRMTAAFACSSVAFGAGHHVILKATKNGDDPVTCTVDLLAQPNQTPLTFLYDNVVFDAQ